ncbi:MAG: DUF6567 family protein [Bacteroidota bacterium]|jgi:hypothetical protein
MKTKLIISLSVLIAAISAGCASGGMFTASNITEVQLQKNNFIIVARNVSGEAEAGYLLGSTFSLGMMTNTVAVLRVSGTGMLYKEAFDDLWKNYEAAHGPVEGKKLALVNVRYDADALNLFVYTRPKVMIRADVVEFTN